MPRRRCLDCGALASATRCTTCEANRKARRDAERSTAKTLTAAANVCAWCGCTLTHAQPQAATGPTAQHRVPFALGGRLEPDATVVCRGCNASAGTRPTPAGKVRHAAPSLDLRP